ncbi:hypothetical protein SPBR_00123 [Sporothrix brasiliensis 5110]|uniref:Peptidase M16 C-terminal domain-containing protein n=1 Tax=Sporothrix brasiliensis 5110 TaxID=1398154 RepID=A0A0C2IPB1_9PEZI|nr:uncharacterized protein SPBR_00123 [Sporothrix brasiliensis 5110]KIH90871.1 hypothetical protein SPBR_00123 [Sporothrix brasiliensis 5110]
MASHFRKTQSFQTSYAPTTITQYVSERSGMTVVVANRKGPKINGYFTLATEIFDDSGAPHTLEHLVFMGSRSYQYKGLLDKLASRAYSGTNAWTAVDHTAYTLETAGWEGFAQILPVYLEHVLLPTITDDACLTEVHHINGKGHDAGVVYSEMQALESNSGELMDLRARRHMYPENVGFRYETGGMVEALRVLTASRIREFHKAMYQPRNLAVIVVGEVDQDNLLSILDEFEESIKDDIPALDTTPFKRPWIDSAQPPAISETIVDTVEFPEDDESIGEIIVGYFGPDCNDMIATSALNVILAYLCGSSASVLENVIVEKEALASSISYTWESRPNSVVWLQPTGVATEKLALVEQRLISLLKEVADGPLDMTYIRDCVSRERRQVKYLAESSESFYSSNIITDYLFGKRDGSTLADLKDLTEYDVLDSWTEEQWRDFLRTWISDAKHISILGKPSKALAKKLKAAEKERVANRKKEIGVDGLKKLQERLDEAKKANDMPIPEEVLDKWEVPGTESIHFIESQTARAGRAKSLGVVDNAPQKILDASKPGQQPLFLQFEDVPSNFVRITVHISTAGVPMLLKPLLWIFSDNFFNSPIVRDGQRVDFEDVVKELEKDTVSYAFRSGGSVGDAESITLQIQLEPSKYTTIIRWLRTLMFDSVFDPVRLTAGVAKSLADIPENKRDGRLMSSEVEMAIHSVRDSFPAARRTLVRAVYLRRLKKLLETETDKVVGWFEELRRSLFAFENMRVLVTADVAQLDKTVGAGLVVSAWDVLTDGLDTARDTVPITPPYMRNNEEGKKPGSIGTVILPMTTLDTSYSVSTAVGLSSLQDPRLPAVLVAIGYLEAVEGPLWNAVRGNGLAYGTNFSRENNGGYLQFRVFRSPDASKALAAARDAVDALASGREPLDKHLVQGAVSGIVMAMADEQATMAMAAQQNYILGVVRGLDAGWSHRTMAAARDVTHDQIRAVMKELIMPVFQPGTSNVVVTCAPLLEAPIAKAFQALGYKTQVKKLADYYDDYGLVVEGDDEEEEEEEEKEEEDEEDEEDEDEDEDYDSNDDSEEDDEDDDDFGRGGGR